MTTLLSGLGFDGVTSGSRPAVAVMAKVPGAAPVKSRLHSVLSPEEATELYRCFLLDRLDAVAALDGVAPIVAFAPEEAAVAMAALAPVGFRLVPQRGKGLGERLSTLLTGLLAEGHSGAIAIDSDSPTLPMAYVRDAARGLEAGAADVVLGPCHDGGYYLVGVRMSVPRLFEDIPWSTERVLEVTLARARSLGLRIKLLPEWFDVDTAADLARLVRSLHLDAEPPARTLAFLRERGG